MHRIFSVELFPSPRAHLHDVGLAAARPAEFGYVVAHHPESGPDAVGGLGQANRRLDLAVGVFYGWRVVKASPS